MHELSNITAMIKAGDYQAAENMIAKELVKFINRLERGEITQANIYERFSPLYNDLLKTVFETNTRIDWIWEVFLELDVYKTYGGGMDIGRMKQLAGKRV